MNRPRPGRADEPGGRGGADAGPKGPADNRCEATEPRIINVRSRLNQSRPTNGGLGFQGIWSAIIGTFEIPHNCRELPAIPGRPSRAEPDTGIREVKRLTRARDLGGARLCSRTAARCPMDCDSGIAFDDELNVIINVGGPRDDRCRQRVRPGLFVDHRTAIGLGQVWIVGQSVA